MHWLYMMSQIYQHDPPPSPPPPTMESLFPKNITENPPHEPYDFNFTRNWHPQNRADRFPSVEQRVKLYMSNWYVPACNQQDLLLHKVERVNNWPRAIVSDTLNHSLELDSVVNADTTFILDRDSIYDCARPAPVGSGAQPLAELYTHSRIFKRSSVQSYCSEVLPLVEYIGGLDQFTLSSERKQTPVIAQFGDKTMQIPTLPQIPILAKWRGATTRQELQKVTSQSCVNTTLRTPLVTASSKYNKDKVSPIVWKLEMCRHWDPLEYSRRHDTKWEDKKLGALWRGDLTGNHLTEVYTNEQICFGNQRCRFVFYHRNSKLVNAGLSSGLHWFSSENGYISGVPVIKGRVSIQQIQKYKVIISMEGNDVASGLKWALLSESVVLMPKPTKSSWAMEELLEPWIHYIPMYDNGTNAEEMIQWVGDNDKEAKKIAERGRLFMYDMLYHPDAAREEREIKAEIAQRYRALFRP